MMIVDFIAHPPATLLKPMQGQILLDEAYQHASFRANDFEPTSPFIFKRNTPQLAAVWIKGMRSKLGLGSA